MQHSLPLTADMLNVLKRNIKISAETFQTKTLDKDDILYPGGQRAVVGSQNWPIIEALKYFVKDGAIKIDNDRFEIINMTYFSISFQSLGLPIQFSIEKHIEATLLVTSALQSDLFEIENRLRYQLEERLIAVYGHSFIPSLPTDVQNNINREKNNPRWHITETRTRELEYTNFSDLIKILVMPDLYVDNKARKALLDKLDYLNEARTRVAHNNPVSGEDSIKIKDYANQVRNLLPQLKSV
jgi:hypothetical protein